MIVQDTFSRIRLWSAVNCIVEGSTMRKVLAAEYLVKAQVSLELGIKAHQEWAQYAGCGSFQLELGEKMKLGCTNWKLSI
jgi:hypothetical protein